MKKTVLIFGLTSGVVTTGILLATIPYINTAELAKSDILGYTSILLSVLLVFFGVRSYREKAGGGRLSFGRGVAVGVLITVVSAAVYTGTFEVLYFRLMPGLGEKYAACVVERARLAGADQKKIEEATEQARVMKNLLDSPVSNVAMTLGVALAIGLASSVAAAAILRKKGASDED